RAAVREPGDGCLAHPGALTRAVPADHFNGVANRERRGVRVQMCFAVVDEQPAGEVGWYVAYTRHAALSCGGVIGIAAGLVPDTSPVRVGRSIARAVAPHWKRCAPARTGTRAVLFGRSARSQ